MVCLTYNGESLANWMCCERDYDDPLSWRVGLSREGRASPRVVEPWREEQKGAGFFGLVGREILQHSTTCQQQRGKKGRKLKISGWNNCWVCSLNWQRSALVGWLLFCEGFAINLSVESIFNRSTPTPTPTPFV